MSRLGIYQYTELESLEHIRLLELLPSSTYEAPIRCTLHATSISEASDTYTAISYAWGEWSVEGLKPIHIDGYEGLITPNLESALRRLRYSGSSRLLWVDALCINQSTDKKGLVERGNQVRLMSRIFPAAKSVLVDLGDVTDEDKLLMDCFEEIEKVDSKDWLPSIAKFNYLMITSEEDDTQLTQRHSTLAWEECFKEPMLLPCIKRFAERGWFTRLWVIQEYALAKEVNIMIGSTLKPSNFLSRTIMRVVGHYMHLIYNDHSLLKLLEKKDFISPDLPKQLEAMARIVSIRKSIQNHQVLSFSEIFHKSSPTKCSDLRDKVYGILGLIGNQEKDKINIDYTQDKDQVALQAANHLLSTGDWRYVLYHCVGVSASGPSWALRLHARQTDMLSTLITPQAETYTISYNACGSSTSELRVYSNLLVTSGYILDAIAETTTALVDSLYADSALARINWQVEVARWIDQHAPDPSFAITVWTSAIADMLNSPEPRRGSSNPKLLQDQIEQFIHYLKPLLLDPAKMTVTEVENVKALRSSQTRDSEARIFRGSLVHAYHRKLAITSKHKICCLVPKATEMGDRVVILLGCPIPFILRPAGNSWRIVGCCYVHGYMDGEVFRSRAWAEEGIVLS